MPSSINHSLQVISMDFIFLGVYSLSLRCRVTDLMGPSSKIIVRECCSLFASCMIFPLLLEIRLEAFRSELEAFCSKFLIVVHEASTRFRGSDRLFLYLENLLLWTDLRCD